MKTETFFDNFEMLANAPNGVQKLREMILQLAVRGKLVPQDEKDEPASMLLDKIKLEKERLIKEKKIRKSQLLPPIEIDEAIFELPKKWEWVRLGQIGDWGSGSTPDRKKTEYYGGSIKWFKSGELNDGYIHESEEKITEKAFRDCSLRLNKLDDVLIAMYGATIGKVAILETEATTNQAVCACTCFNGFYNRYLFYLLKAYRQRFFNQGAGAAQPNISREKIIHTIAPLPPLAEQHRIVAKVDQLMSLCDELEARQQKKRESRARLNNAALDRLLAARAQEDFTQSWRRVCDNFDLLYDVPENVGALRQAILQLAILGRLVAQDENDEPASILLEKVKAEKERLVKEKKINNARALPTIDEGEIPYNLPKGWQWSRLGDICRDWGQKKPDVEFTYIDVSAIDKEHGVISDAVKILKPNEAPSRARKIVCKGTVIYATVRPYLLNIAIVDKEIEPEPIVSTAFAILHPLSGVLNRYLYYYLRSKPFIAYVESEMTGMAYPAINDGKLYLGLVPLPPSNEQHRIVAKVDQFMSLCDSLEAGLARSQADSKRLMEAVVGRMLAG